MKVKETKHFVLYVERGNREPVEWVCPSCGRKHSSRITRAFFKCYCGQPVRIQDAPEKDS